MQGMRSVKGTDAIMIGVIGSVTPLAICMQPHEKRGEIDKDSILNLKQEAT